MTALGFPRHVSLTRGWFSYKYKRTKAFYIFHSTLILLVISLMSTTIVSFDSLLSTAIFSLSSSLTGKISIFHCHLAFAVQIFMIFFLEMHADRV